MSIGASLLGPRSALAFALVLAPVGCAGADAHADHPASAPAVAGAAAALHEAPAAPARAVATLPAPPSDADPGAPKADDPKPEALPVAGTDFVRGRAKVKVNAPIDKVREAVLDFPHYADFMPHYRSAKLLGRTATGARDVYMEIEALYGAIKMWAEIELPKPTIVDGVETYETKFVKGNVKEFQAIWRIAKIDEATTELSLEVFLHPSIPMPTNLMNNENLNGSVSGVQAMRAHAEAAAAKP